MNNSKIKFKIYSTAPAWEGFPAGVLASAPLSQPLGGGFWGEWLREPQPPFSWSV
ncbi:MAG: hypothetical protein AB7E26_07350 [Chryseobacterium sp.]